MKKKNSIALLLLLTPCIARPSCCRCDDCSDEDYTSQSFMFARPLSQNLSAIQSGWHNIIHDRHGDGLAAIQVVGLFQQSMYHEKTAQYFLFNNKKCLHVAGDNAQTTNTRDIRAEWLGLPDNFSGTFTIDPRQRQVGFLIEYNQLLRRFFTSDLFDRFWISLSLPIVAVENDIQLNQFDILNRGTGGEAPKDIVEAFQQKEWCYAKIGEKRSKLEMSHIRLALGSTYMSENNFQLAYYSHFTFATADRDPAHYLFDAVVGPNGHFGMGAGVNMQIVLTYDTDPVDVCFYLDIEHTFLIRRNQMRTVDLLHKPWSRYLLLNRIDRGPDLKIPAVNVLTMKFKVRPYSMVDFGFGFRIKKGELELELGYGIWGKGDEKLDELICPFPTIYGIAGKSEPGDTKPRTANLSTINTLEYTADEEVADPNQTFVPILESDLDLHSGISRSVINHRVHLSLSSKHEGKKIDGTFGAGFFYELPQRNSSLKQWGLWGKVAASF